jgi:hypothetical protein
MKNKLTYLCGILLLFCTHTRLHGQAYVDFFPGLHPRLVDDGSLTLHLNLAVGRQASERVGYGANVGVMAIVTTSTSSSFSMLGVQYRLMDNNHRFYGKAEFGSLLSSAYTTDGPLKFTYQNNFNPYYRIYWGYRLGRVVMGMNYTYINPFAEDVAEFDENLSQYVPTGRVRMRDMHDIQLFIGISLDTYPVKRRKGY